MNISISLSVSLCLILTTITTTTSPFSQRDVPTFEQHTRNLKFMRFVTSKLRGITSKCLPLSESGRTMLRIFRFCKSEMQTLEPTVWVWSLINLILTARCDTLTS